MSVHACRVRREEFGGISKGGMEGFRGNTEHFDLNKLKVFTGLYCGAHNFAVYFPDTWAGEPNTTLSMCYPFPTLYVQD